MFSFSDYFLVHQQQHINSLMCDVCREQRDTDCCCRTGRIIDYQLFERRMGRYWAVLGCVSSEHFSRKHLTLSGAGLLHLPSYQLWCHAYNILVNISEKYIHPILAMKNT